MDDLAFTHHICFSCPHLGVVAGLEDRPATVAAELGAGRVEPGGNHKWMVYNEDPTTTNQRFLEMGMPGYPNSWLVYTGKSQVSALPLPVVSLFLPKAETSSPFAMETKLFGPSFPDPLFTGVVCATSHCDGSTLGQRLPCGEPMMVVGMVLPKGLISLYDFGIQGRDDFTYLNQTEASWWTQVPAGSGELSPSILELCAGVGGMGIGASFLGGVPILAVDSNGLSCSHLTHNAHGEVLQLDITASGSAKMIHQKLSDRPGTAMFGFPCQPYSQQGNQLGSRDVRFQVFLSGLHIIFMTRAQSAILECVPAAGEHPDIVKGIQLLALAMDWDVLNIQLDLQDQWPCRRARWWALLLPKAWNVYGLHPWPSSSPFQKVGDLFECWGSWSEDEETDLQLYSFEFEAYTNPAHGSDRRLLSLDVVASTFLHSYGNALLPCPCGCRLRPFSSRTLLDKGLRGCFVQSAVHQNPRYLHPRELGLLLGLPDSVVYPQTPRASLALLGLVASPIQAVWIYAHLRNNYAKALELPMLPSPSEWLSAYQHELLRQTRSLFRHRSAVPQSLLLRDQDGFELCISSPTAVTVAQLLGAQRISLEWNEVGSITHDGVPLPLNAFLDSLGGPYALTSHEGSSSRQAPQPTFLIGIKHRHDFAVSILHGGQFLFEALRMRDIHQVNFLVDVDGKVYGADFRVWKSLNLSTLDPAFWPPSFPLRAAGRTIEQSGLHDGHISWTLDFLKQLVKGPFQPVIIHPKMALQIFASCPDTIRQVRHEFTRSDDRIICVFPHASHWVLLFGHLQGTHLSWRYCDGLGDQASSRALQLAALVSDELSLDWTFEPWRLIDQRDPHTCGTIALFHAGALLGFFGVPSQQAIFDFHDWLLQRPTLGLLGDPWIYGSGPATGDTQASLAALLATKGVPSMLAADRAAAAIKKLGHQAVTQALSQSNPWQALKALTTRPGHGFQFVQKLELKEYIDAKAQSKHGATLASSKKKDKKPFKSSEHAPVKLDPATLQLDPTHFVDDEGDQVPQINLSQVVADARGLAIASLTEALPYLQERKHISADALGLLILEEVPANLKASAEIISIRFPVTYLPTKDPLLINGSLLQLGDHEISRRPVPDPVSAMDLAESNVLKVLIYRDELESIWSQIAESPVRQLLQLVPLLRLCTLVSCDHKCGKFHAPVEDNIDQVIHEVWGRRFQTIEGRTKPAPDAELFMAFLRIAAPALDELLRVVVDGVYLEPRATGSKATDGDYSVVWLPGATRETAVHRLKLTTHGLSLVRMKSRFGIRVIATYEEAAHRELRPGDSFIGVDVSRIYRLHPLPHGLQRQQVVQLLKDWHWQAKPLQPSRGSAEGSSWEVGASSEPPANDRLQSRRSVSLVKNKSEVDRAPMVVGPMRAQKHLRSHATSSASSSVAATDPWLSPGQDPWQSYKGASSSDGAHTKRYDALVDKLTTDVQASLQHTGGPDSSSVETRFVRLENDMKEIKAHNATFHSWFTETGTRLAHQDEQLTNLKTAVQQQQHDLQAVRTEVHTSADTLHQAMQTSFGAMKNDLAAELTGAVASQMDRIENMLSKRQRSES